MHLDIEMFEVDRLLTCLSLSGANVNFDTCIDDGASAALFGSSGVGLALGSATQVSCNQWSGSANIPMMITCPARKEEEENGKGGPQVYTSIQQKVRRTESLDAHISIFSSCM